MTGTDFDYHRDVKNEPLEHYLARQTKPDLGFRFREISFHGERIVVLIIPAEKDVPTSFDKDRYCRIGSSNAVAEVITALVKKPKLREWQRAIRFMIFV